VGAGDRLGQRGDSKLRFYYEDFARGRGDWGRELGVS
jgi:hypothetical protein